MQGLILICTVCLMIVYLTKSTRNTCNLQHTNKRQYLLYLTFNITWIRCGLVVRIPGFHPGGPGSIPGTGIIVLIMWSEVSSVVWIYNNDSGVRLSVLTNGPFLGTFKYRNSVNTTWDLLSSYALLATFSNTVSTQETVRASVRPSKFSNIYSETTRPGVTIYVIAGISETFGYPIAQQLPLNDIKKNGLLRLTLNPIDMSLNTFANSADLDQATKSCLIRIHSVC